MFNDAAQTRAPGIIVGRDPLTDLAVVKVGRRRRRRWPNSATPTTLAVGDPVIAIGSPLGLAGTVTTGIVSAKDRPVRLQGGGSDTDAVIDALQTDAAVNPGNSGGALVDGTGAVVGINTAIRTLGGDTSGSIGLGFAIPINAAKDIAQQIIRDGSVQHASMGLNARSATDGVTDGAQVQNVQDGGPAAAAGIVEGDVITKVGDRAVGNADELVVAIRSNAGRRDGPGGAAARGPGNDSLGDAQLRITSHRGSGYPDRDVPGPAAAGREEAGAACSAFPGHRSGSSCWSACSCSVRSGSRPPSPG